MPRTTQDTTRSSQPCPYGTVTRCGTAFQRLPVRLQDSCRGPTTPPMPEHRRFGLLRVRSPLLAESLLFSLPTGTKMFQFPAFAHRLAVYQVFNLVGCPIRKPADQWSFAPPRGLSQLITSFFAFQSQGIHQMPFCFLSFFSCVLFLKLCPSCQRSLFSLSDLGSPISNISWRIRDSNP